MLGVAKPRLVIMASTNPDTTFLRGIKLPFNIIVTADRRADRFASFLRKLFRSMFEGRALALSWARLFPQDDGPGNDSEPLTFCAPIYPGLFFAAAR
jgi:hypothetical protein